MVCLDPLPQLTEAFTPEEIDIGTRLEPFLPDLMPAVGLPYDGLEVLAPCFVLHPLDAISNNRNSHLGRFLGRTEKRTRCLELTWCARRRM